jgi:hypothetical protein
MRTKVVRRGKFMGRIFVALSIELTKALLTSDEIKLPVYARETSL